jgi:hypothetical protein
VRRKSLKVVVFSLLWIMGLLVIGGAALYWKLSQGPLSLAFMGKSIESAINKQLPGFKIKLGETELELDTETGTPNVRVRNLVLSDETGQVIASAPKAGVALEASSLLRGAVSIKTLDLIGPKINIRRNLDGSMQLGIANEAVAEDQAVVIDSSELSGEVTTKSDNTLANKSPLVSGSKLLAMLDAGGETGTLSKLEEVRLSRGTLQFYDESNEATWIAPRADLAFRRVASGFVIAAKAEVKSEGGPWKLEASTTFRKKERNFTANVAVQDIVPAYVAREIYALSQFARLNTPLSGNFEITAEETGKLTSLEGQVFASAGQFNLPEYLANPILIDEGTLRIRQQGSGAPYEILESSMLMGGSRADLKGTIAPQVSEEGRVVAYVVDLTAGNVAVDTQGTVKDAVTVDRVSYKGSFAVEEQRVDIDDLVVMAGSTGIRMRGVITGGEESAGISVAGRMRDVDSVLLKKLWPPILAPKTREWITENVDSGRVSDGTFEVKFAPNELAEAQRTKVLPPNAVKLTVAVRDVVTRYFKKLPVLNNASGTATLKDAAFKLDIDGGFVNLPSGKKLSLSAGTFGATELLSGAALGTFRFDIQGGVQELLEFASLPDLNLVKDELNKLPQVGGKARAIIGLKLPLIKNVPKERVALTQEVSLSNASLKAIMPGIDLTEGDFAISIDKDSIGVNGPAKLNGVAAKIDWQKKRSGGEPRVLVETVVTQDMRNKLGIKLDAYMTGNVPAKIEIVSADDKSRKIDVEADLSDVSIKIATAGFTRPATSGTRATFTVIDSGKSGRRIEDLVLKGKGLALRGRIDLSASNALKVIDLDEIRLGEDDVFAVRIEPGDGMTRLSISGNSFDGRPYIKKLISPAKAGSGDAEGPKGGDFAITARFKLVTAHRGEEVRDVEATFLSSGGKIVEAEMTGKFLSGFPINISLKPVAGGRELTVASTDGGSALRAANFYSKVAGGNLEFNAVMANEPGSPIRKGNLTLRRFDVRNEAALAELDRKGRPKKSGPRVEAVRFKKLVLPFSTDAKFVRMCNVSLEGPDLGGIAEGLIRKQDGALDITGTMVPAQGINGFLDDVPLFGQLLTGGKGGGIFGVTFAMGGSIASPRTQVNPLSVFAPGVLRELFQFKGTCSTRRNRNAQGQ